MNTPPTGTVTFLFTDIAGSTRIAQEFPDAMPALLARHHAILHEAIAKHRGTVFQIVGDAFCAAFHIATDALDAAIDAQRALQREAWSPAPIKVRMGINTGTAQAGELDPVAGGYSGYSALARAQRVMSAAYPGQILVSNSSAELLRGDIPANISLRDMGEHRLKGIPNPERLWQVVAPDLPRDFPALPTLNAIPNNLPIQLTSFVGREQDIVEVQQALATTRLLTLTGSGGTGKTRLSLQVAAEVLDRFPDGAWFVELAPLSDPSLVPLAVAGVLGLREEPQRAIMPVLLQHLQSRQLLLILDNCEHLIEACAVFADTVLRACRDVRILGSSREALGIAGELTWRVPSLPTAEPDAAVGGAEIAEYAAVRLFTERAALALPSFRVTDANARAVAQICWRLGGIPLAVELAAIRVKTMPVDQIAERLDDCFRLLTGGSRAAPPRQQTLRATIDWSYDLLSIPERVLFRRLAVFAGGWTIEAAEDVCSGDRVVDDEPGSAAYDVLDLLTRLVDKSLVILEERDRATRYRMLATIRQYAGEVLRDSGDTPRTEEKLAGYLVRWAEDAEPHLKTAEQMAWLCRFDSELPNLRAAFAWSRANRCTESLLRLAGATWFYRSRRGIFAEEAAWRASVLAADDAAQYPLRLAQVLAGAGMFEWLKGDYPAARAVLEQSITLARQTGAEGNFALATALFWLGVTAMREGRFAAAREAATESGALAREMRYPWGVGLALYGLGRIALESGDDTAASALSEQSCTVFREVGDRWQLALSLASLGLVAMRRGDYVAARTIYQESLALRKEMQDQWGLAASLASLGEVERIQGNDQRAEELYGENLRLARELGMTGDTARALHNLGYTALHRGDRAAAKESFRSSLLLFRELRNGRGIAECLLGYAAVAEPEARSVVLIAASDTLLKQIGAVRWPADRLEYDRLLAEVRAELEEERFTEAWATGCQLTVEQAIAYAMQSSQS